MLKYGIICLLCILGNYLAAEVDHDTTFDPMRHKLRGATDQVYHLIVDCDALESVHTIFELESTTIQRSDQMVPRWVSCPSGVYHDGS